MKGVIADQYYIERKDGVIRYALRIELAGSLCESITFGWRVKRLFATAKPSLDRILDNKNGLALKSTNKRELLSKRKVGISKISLRVCARGTELAL